MKKKIIQVKEKNYNIDLCLKHKDKYKYYLGEEWDFEFQKNGEFKWGGLYPEEEVSDDSIYISSEYWEKCPEKLKELSGLIPDVTTIINEDSFSKAGYSIYPASNGFFLIEEVNGS